MSIDRVPEVPFAQIANAALRDNRLSFAARGILAHVLSHSGVWDAGRDYLVSESPTEGQKAVQRALNELTRYGYRSVQREQLPNGRWTTWVEWHHSPSHRL